LAILGYGFAYRVLDAQYFGVAQRRKRVFVVGYLGDWRPAAAVLFERHSLQGHPAPSREKGENSSIHAGKGIAECSPTIGCELAKQVNNQMIGNAEAFFIPDTPAQPIALAENTIGRKPENGGNGDGFTENGPMYTLNATGVHGVAQPIAYNISPGTGASKDDIYVTDAHASKTLDASASNPAMHQEGTAILQAMAVIAPTLTAANDPSRSPQSSEVTQQVYSVLQASMAVRRLTPVECERLQGFPDKYTDIQPKGKATPDGPRYKALGNSMAVPVMAWIGKRIQEVDALL